MNYLTSPPLNVNHFLLLSVQKIKVRGAAFQIEVFWGVGGGWVMEMAVSQLHTQQYDECSCSLPRQWLFWSGECDDACFTAQNALIRQLLELYPGQASWIAGLLTTGKRAGQIHISWNFSFPTGFLSLLQNYTNTFLISLCPCLSSRYRHTVSLGSIAIMCGFCKPPQSLEATKGCADCKSNFCNECFKLYHPWGTPRAQHEHILPTNNFRPKVWLFLCFFAWHAGAFLLLSRCVNPCLCSRS